MQTMYQEFPPPPRAAEFSELVKKKLEEARASGGTRETVTVELHGQRLNVDVIDLPLDGLYYNPGTHRIRAQRSHDPVANEILEKDPYSDQAQEYMRFLLQADPADPSQRDRSFETLLKDLREFGQNEPGLVTHHGVAVNGNTRLAALRESGMQSMRMGVLPESLTWADINSIELALQLRMDHRRDYSYINRLLAMEEQAKLGRTPEMIAKEFRIQKSTYHQERWILSAIREFIERSESKAGTALRLVDFENHQEKLKEMQRAYANLEAADRDQAETLKETRIAAIVLGFSKTDVRHIDEHFLQRKYLDDVLPADLKSGPSVGTDGTEASDPELIPGLGMALPTAADTVTAARSLSNRILQAKAVAVNVDGGLAEEAQKNAQGLVDSAREAFNAAIDRAGRDARVRKRKQQAPARLAEACTAIDHCVADLVQARASRTLDEEAFDDAVQKLQVSLRKLAQQASRGLPAPGDGVSWLIAAASAEGSR
ncbi:hypothetical protein ACFV5N_10290 [Streptomyces sp. NPDC059853]|uniref:hypothetical protein n=1 Tax=Streptomyces sp. NPDC059853 TaxID=3346973 RepID=UPI00364BEAF2